MSTFNRKQRALQHVHYA